MSCGFSKSLKCRINISSHNVFNVFEYEIHQNTYIQANNSILKSAG